MKPVFHYRKDTHLGHRILNNCIAIFISLFIIFQSFLIAKENGKDTWPIPACAWSRPLGDHPIGSVGVLSFSTLTTKRGIPLGGIGAGNFMFNLCGTFGPWEFKTGLHEEKFLSQAAFHIYEHIPGKTPVVKTLATDDVLSGWNKLQQDSGVYYALYPKAWFTYSGTTADVSLKQFTPIIPHNYRQSSYPVGIFQFKLSNPTSDTIAVAVMFTYPNAAYGDDKRTGFTNRTIQEDGITGVVMAASSPDNQTTTQNTEWCIAAQEPAGSHVTFCSSWNGDGNGQDIYDDFSKNGMLCDSAIDSSFTASAIAVKITLAPGSATVVPFVLSWDFPRVKFVSGTEWYRRYTEYFGFTGDHSFQIAKEALLNMNNWETSVDKWQQLIIDEPSYPEWLKQGALNELYFDTFGGVFWENGCITKPAESSFGTLPPIDHKYFCMDFGNCELLDSRHYEARHLLELWPEIERDVLKWYADDINNNPAGNTPHDEGDPYFGDPFFSSSSGFNDFQDNPSKFIQEVYAYYHKTHDETFLDFVWPACLRTYNYLKTLDRNHDGIPDCGESTYHAWNFIGDNMLSGGLYIGALEAMEQIALEKRDTSFSKNMHQSYINTRRVIDSLLWLPQLQYYRVDVGSNTMLADGLNGDRYCETTGLDPILPVDQIVSHLNNVYDLCVKPLKDYNGDGEGDLGVANAANVDPNVGGGGLTKEVWAGVSYFIAAMMYHYGVQTNNSQLKDNALKSAYGTYYQTWLNNETAYFFDTPLGWGIHDPATLIYKFQCQPSRAIWELLLEIKNPFDTLTSIAQIPTSKTPNRYTLYQNYPNPFNPSTQISFNLPARAKVSLEIFDLMGRKVQTLISGDLPAGNHLQVWNATNFPSGVYFYRLRAGAFSETKKLILTK